MKEEIWSLISLLYSVIVAYCLHISLRKEYMNKFNNDKPAFIFFSIFWPISLLIGGGYWIYEKICKKN